jgi:hypothetical protein
VLASGLTHWYTSGTAWTAIGAVLTAIALLVTVMLWLRGSPRRMLVHSVSDSSLLSKSRPTVPELTVTLDRQVLTDPHVISFYIESRSPRDIRSAEFEAARPLTFDMHQPILKLLNCQTGGRSMPEVAVTIDGSLLLIGPSLIQRHQIIRVEFLTEGPVWPICVNPSLPDVRIRDGSGFLVQPRWEPWIWRLAVAPLFVVVAIQLATHGIHRIGNGPAIDISFVWLFGCLVMSLVLSLFGEGDGIFLRGTLGDSGSRVNWPRYPTHPLPEGMRIGWDGGLELDPDWPDQLPRS